MHHAYRLLIALALLTGLSLAIIPHSASATFPAGSNGFFGSPQISSFNDMSETTSINAYTEEPEEPGHRPGGFGSAGKSAWWRWTAPVNGLVTIDTLTSSTLPNPVQDTVIAVYTGSMPANLLRVAGNEDHGSLGIQPSHQLSSATFWAIQGSTYHIAVDGSNISDIDASRTNLRLQVRLTELKKSIRSAVFAALISPDGFGTITVTTTASTTLSGKFVLGGKSYPFAGTFGSNGYFTTSFLPKPTPAKPQPVPITLKLDLAGVGKYFVDLGTEANTSFEFPTRITFNPVFQNSTAGLYPCVQTTVDPFDSGIGIASVNIKTNGTITGTCIGIDGFKHTFSSALQQTSEPGVTYHFPVYVPLHQNRGCFAMNGYVTEKPTGDEIIGNAFLLRPVPTSGSPLFYPSGIALPLYFKGTSYPKPPGNPVLDFLNPTYTGKLTIINAAAELLGGNVDEDLTFTSNNKFIFASAVKKPVLTLNTATGLITGSITEPGGKKRILNAVLTKVEGDTTLVGHLVGNTRTLLLTVTP